MIKRVQSDINLKMIVKYELNYTLYVSQKCKYNSSKTTTRILTNL